MNNHGIYPHSFEENHVAHRTLDEMVIFHRAAAVFDDERLPAEKLDERERFDEKFRTLQFRFEAHDKDRPLPRPIGQRNRRN